MAVLKDLRDLQDFYGDTGDRPLSTAVSEVGVAERQLMWIMDAEVPSHEADSIGGQLC